MKLSVATKYALRSLGRHGRRSVLSIVGIAVGCTVSLVMISFVRGEGEMMMRAAAQSGTGHLRAVPREWTRVRNPDLRLPHWQKLLDRLRQIEPISVAAPRARTEALLAFGTRTTGVEMVGVDPEAEPQINRLIRRMKRGRYLRPEDSHRTVVGAAITDRLDVEVGDDLMVTVSGPEEGIRSAMLEIVGVVETGSRDLDASICHINLPDIESITGRDGAAEISMLANDPDHLRRTVEKVKSALPPDATVVTWAEILPELASGVEVDETWTNLMVGLVVIVVFLGIASAQLTAVLERRREFAVMAAVGMHGTQLLRAMLTEGLVLGLAGGGLGLLLGIPLTYLMATRGIDFTALYADSDLAVSNILLDPVIYGDFGWWLVPLALGLALAATLLSSLYPAWYAVKTDPADALRVER